MPLVEVLAAMERKGVLLDLPLLKTMSLEIEQLLTLSEEKIYRLAGEKFNINSPKQLQVILFDKMGLPRGRKTKEGYSTDVDVLSALALSHELPAEILAYRGMAKLKSTYIDALPELVHPRTGRVHTSYNQTVTATGRLSSSNPNLQNIPIRTLEGKRIRQAFIAPPGWEIVSADYSQIELRVLAHLSGDESLIRGLCRRRGYPQPDRLRHLRGLSRDGQRRDAAAGEGDQFRRPLRDERLRPRKGVGNHPEARPGVHRRLFPEVCEGPKLSRRTSRPGPAGRLRDDTSSAAAVSAGDHEPPSPPSGSSRSGRRSTPPSRGRRRISSRSRWSGSSGVWRKTASRRR